ncbi:MAG: LLM class flavin-dependent oxidoreductase, partial [Dehalococcoidia bacterium]
DIVSAGRAVLGIGAAWYEAEHAGYGFDFPPVRERMDRLEEALQLCRAMFTEAAPSFDGRYYHIDQALNYPRPVRPGGPPILIGGTGERRTLRLAARYADAWNLPTTPSFEQIPGLLATLERHCEAEGRDPDSITKTALRTLVIAPTQSAAERKAAALRAAMGVDEDTFRCRVLAGGPEAIMDQARSYLDLGLDGIFVNLPDTQDLETVALAGETLAKVMRDA